MDIAQLKKAKKERNLTYEQLSQKSGVPISTIYDIFRGVTSAPRIDTMRAIEEALGLNKSLEWTDEDKAEGVGRYPTYLSEDETRWLELRSEIIRAHGEDYLKTLNITLEALTKQKK